jgi:hypothetical protein
MKIKWIENENIDIQNENTNETSPEIACEVIIK